MSDNVMLSTVASPIGGGPSAASVVPVPPALPLLFSALAGLAFLRHRRSAR